MRCMRAISVVWSVFTSLESDAGTVPPGLKLGDATVRYRLF